MPEYSLLVYVDNALTPMKVDTFANDATELVIQIQKVIGLPIVSISHWDEATRDYLPLKTLEPLLQGKNKVWVATSGVKAMPITEEKDALEYGTIREQVEKLTPPDDGLIFEVREILRVQNHLLEQRFRGQRQNMFDRNARTVLKFYADSQPIEQIMKTGFRMPTTAGPYGYGVIFSSDIAVSHVTDSIRLLLCEIAVGRYTILHNEEDRGTTAEVMQHMGYDSVLARISAHPSLPKLEEHVIYNANQAIPRYLVTCGLSKAKGNQRSKGADVCKLHPGEIMKLWCLNCDKLVCAFCMFGEHQGHHAKDVAEVSEKERDLLLRCEAVLQRTIETRQRDLGDLEKMKAHYNGIARDTCDELGKTVQELHELLDTQHQELLRQVNHRETVTGQRLAQYTNPLQEELGKLLAKQTELREALDLVRTGRPSAMAIFLSRTTDLHNNLNTHPKFDEAPDPTSHVPTLELHVDGTRAKDSIKQMAVDDRQPHPQRHVHPLGATALYPEGLLARDNSMDTTESRLHCLESGHIWVIPNVSEHFRVDQTRDIFSDPFLMAGQYWELKISFLPVERALAVYLHAVRHHHRTNFKIALFKSSRWHIKSTRNWSEEFKGRGWGIKPFIAIDELNNYVENNTLKWVVVFTGNGLY